MLAVVCRNLGVNSKFLGIWKLLEFVNMSVFIQVDGHSILFNGPCNLHDIKKELFKDVSENDLYFTYNGKKLLENTVVENGIVHASSRIFGGKGGFGSMLRAIGAQIEKTTNREACRDLSGRRLRDINEEKRLKNWIAQQAEREREAAERRKKKLERLCFEPRHDFADQSYEKERSELTEKVYDAVEQGFRLASTSTSELKRKPEPQGSSQSKKRKTCLWVDDIEDEDLGSDDSDSDIEQTKVVGREEIHAKSYSQNSEEDSSNEKSETSNEVHKNEDLCSVSSADATNKESCNEDDNCVVVNPNSLSQTT